MRNSQNETISCVIRNTDHKTGFSLVELSVVMVVIGVLVASTLTFVDGYTKGHQIKETQAKLDAIERALVVHLIKFGYLPCPSSRTALRGTAGFGISTTACNAAAPAGTVDVNTSRVRIGMVPVKSLGLPESHAFDGWGNRITYATIRNLAVNKATYDAYETTDTNGVIIMQDGSGHLLYHPYELNITAYALISHGSDGNGAFNRNGSLAKACNAAAKDGENCNYTNSLFLDMPINDGDMVANYFNDYVRWKQVSAINYDAIH